MSSDHRADDYNVWPWLLGRIVFLIVALALIGGGFVAYRMLEHGNVKQAVGEGDVIAVRAFLLLSAPSDELLRELFLIAVVSQEIDIVRYLLDKGVDPNVPAREGELPALDHFVIWYARTQNREEMAQLLVKSGAEFGVRHHAAMGNLDDVVAAVATEPALATDPMPEFHNMTLLHYACGGGQLAVAKWLLEHGAALDVESAGGQTPFDMAIFSENKELVLLLEAALNDQAPQKKLLKP